VRFWREINSSKLIGEPTTPTTTEQLANMKRREGRVEASRREGEGEGKREGGEGGEGGNR
jgi:hypothetical protein